MTDNSFFNESTEQSRIKAQIVEKYFSAWSKVIVRRAKKSHDRRIAYVDLFAGPGQYQDGTRSTPLMILETIANSDDLRNMVVTIFNDANADNIQSLKEAIDALPHIETLRYRPILHCEAVGSRIVHIFDITNGIPTLFFVDPWGYKGLTLRLISSLIRSWGSECIFFFNYNRISMGLANPIVDEHLNALFGIDRARTLRIEVDSVSSSEREYVIVEALARALRDAGAKYVLPFRFKSESVSRTSHHLIFVSKNFVGYHIMKEVMAKTSSSVEDGVPSLEYNPATIRQPLLFQLSQPIEALGDMLCRDYAGETLSMWEIYERHSVDKPLIDSNYKEALRRLEEQGRIKADPPANKRRKDKFGKVTFGEKVLVTFPKIEPTQRVIEVSPPSTRPTPDSL